jgi:hypothetical protein
MRVPGSVLLRKGLIVEVILRPGIGETVVSGGGLVHFLEEHLKGIGHLAPASTTRKMRRQSLSVSDSREMHTWPSFGRSRSELEEKFSP